MTFDEAENLRKNWENSFCNHSTIQPLTSSENDAENIYYGQFACAQCGHELNDMEHPEYFYPLEVAKLREAALEIADQEVNWRKEDKHAENIEETVVSVSAFANEIFNIAFWLYRAEGVKDVDLMIRAMRFAFVVAGGEIQCSPESLKPVLQVLISIAGVTNDPEYYKKSPWDFLYDLDKGIKAYKAIKR